MAAANTLHFTSYRRPASIHGLQIASAWISWFVDTAQIFCRLNILCSGILQHDLCRLRCNWMVLDAIKILVNYAEAFGQEMEGVFADFPLKDTVTLCCLSMGNIQNSWICVSMYKRRCFTLSAGELDPSNLDENNMRNCISKALCFIAMSQTKRNWW